jgi:hypothetical protein
MSKRKDRKKLSEAEIDAVVISQANDESAWEEPIHVPAKPWAQRIRVRRLELAARFHVLSVLYCLGAEPTVSVGSEKDVDITVVRRPGDVVTVDVKAASESKSWNIAEFAINQSHYVVFVYFSHLKEAVHPESYIWPSHELKSWASERDGIVEMRQLMRSAQDAREAWERLLPAA